LTKYTTKHYTTKYNYCSIRGQMMKKELAPTKELINQKALSKIKKPIDRKRVMEICTLLNGRLSEETVKEVFANLKENPKVTHSQYNSSYYAYKKYLKESTDSIKFRNELRELFNQDEIKPYAIGYNIKELPNLENVTNAIHSSNPSLAYIIKFMANTGLRISEVINIKLSDVTFNGVAHIRFEVLKKKTPIIETIDLPKEFVKEIVEHFHGKEKGIFLFQTKNGKQYNRVNLSNQIKAQLGFSAHKLRHYFAHDVYEKEGIVGVNKLLHQSSMDVTSKYLQKILSTVNYSIHFKEYNK